jgi:hypothetical protein
MSQPQRQWQSTGEGVYVNGPELDRIPDFDPRSGEHLWIWSVVFRADPVKLADPTSTPMLDHENLLSIAGPGCFYCQRSWGGALAGERCPGHP